MDSKEESFAIDTPEFGFSGIHSGQKQSRAKQPRFSSEKCGVLVAKFLISMVICTGKGP